LFPRPFCRIKLLQQIAEDGLAFSVVFEGSRIEDTNSGLFCAETTLDRIFMRSTRQESFGEACRATCLARRRFAYRHARPFSM
jgi:hypothetical protein